MRNSIHCASGAFLDCPIAAAATIYAAATIERPEHAVH
jgi:hypothetical protein